MELERDVEQALTRYAHEVGGMCVKFNPDSKRGMPDRIVLLPGGVVVWVELKRPKGGSVSAVQKHRHKQLHALGQIVVVCRTKEDARQIIETYAATGA